MAYETKWKVALVDDRPESIELLSYALRKNFRDLEVQTSCPEQVLDRPWDFQAVITRYRLLGNTDGIELTRKLRQKQYAAPIIMVSNADELAAAAMAAGVDEFISFERWTELPSRLVLRLNRELSA
jgi:CheY-like chemotaxis protein